MSETKPSMTLHTPGNWRISPVGDRLDGESLIYTGQSPDDINGARIAWVAGGLGFNGDECFESAANARLIAAAPDLLAACNALLRCQCYDVAPGECCPCRAAADAAINKATGA